MQVVTIFGAAPFRVVRKAALLHSSCAFWGFKHIFRQTKPWTTNHGDRLRWENEAAAVRANTPETGNRKAYPPPSRRPPHHWGKGKTPLRLVCAWFLSICIPFTTTKLQGSARLFDWHLSLLSYRLFLQTRASSEARLCSFNAWKWANRSLLPPKI